VLKRLGGAHTFRTQFLGDREASAGDINNLYVRGGGDPALVVEDLFRVVLELQQRGVRAVQDVVVDSSLFLSPPPAGAGLDPYRAGLSAASVNFNSFSVAIYPGAASSPALVSLSLGAPYKLRSSVLTGGGEEGIKLALAEGQVKVSGRIDAGSPGKKLYYTVSDPAYYLGTMVLAVLRAQGVQVRGDVRLGKVPAAARLVTEWSSKQLQDILVDLNHYSNNFIAGQLVYQLGPLGDGTFDFQRGLSTVKESLQEGGVDLSGLTIVDGSGLSRENRATVAQIAGVLRLSTRDLSIAPSFVASLSRFGATGTVKRRRLPLLGGTEWERSDGVWAKTGSLDGVSSLAGVAARRSGKQFVFAIVLNGSMPKDEAIEIENRFVSAVMRME
jgi:D-alanyl-D-alanine carboxypeptidase/D-alanyl-D-alanine-endopeptidase (penicillin-binding protein 4)